MAGANSPVTRSVEIITDYILKIDDDRLGFAIADVSGKGCQRLPSDGYAAGGHPLRSEYPVRSEKNGREAQ